ncbi:hypothetical protein JCM5296_003260 [Sporobolomyces johnsonii]
MLTRRAKGSRGAVSQSKDHDARDENLHVHYCLCGEFVLVVDSPLPSLPRRPSDRSYALVNAGPSKRVYKLNVSEEGKDLVKPPPAAVGEDGLVVGGGAGAAGKTGNGVLVLREGAFEYQRRLYCPRCQLQVGYETKPGEHQKGDVTFILAGALTDTQNKVPSDAFGEPAVAPAGSV